jgi:hypothetical protein
MTKSNTFVWLVTSIRDIDAKLALQASRAVNVNILRFGRHCLPNQFLYGTQAAAALFFDLTIVSFKRTIVSNKLTKEAACVLM